MREMKKAASKMDLKIEREFGALTVIMRLTWEGLERKGMRIFGFLGFTEFPLVVH